VVFQDETGFTLHPRLGFGWARRGQRLRVPTTSQHHARLNLSGWVAPLLGRYGMIRTEQGNREGFLEVLRHLYRHLRGLQIILYVDGALWHKGAPVHEFLRTHPRLQLQYLPAYQPALNRQERIWRRVRYEATTNCWFATLDDIWDTVQRATGAWTPRKLQRLCNIT
jgi:hypothetical protein